MKNHRVLLIVISIFSLGIYLSNSSGPGSVSGLAVTTAPGESGNFCGSAGCHTEGSIEQTTTIEVRDTMDQVMTDYEPGITYQVRVIITASSGQPNAYGFQMVSLIDSDNTDVNGWDLSSSEGIHTIELIDRSYIEHDVPNIDSNSFSVGWVAPEEGTGSVTFYAAGNAVNLNGSNTGDGPDTTKFTLEEAIASSIKDNFFTGKPVQLFPNPVEDVMNIDVESIENYYLRIVDIAGREHFSKNISSSEYQINVRDWVSGIYFVNIFDVQSGHLWTGKIIIE